MPAPSDATAPRLSCRAVGGAVELDLGDTWLEPRDLAGAAALASRYRRAGTPFRVHVGPSLAGYASRMRLGRVLEELGAAHDLPSVTARPRATDLLEVTRLRTGDDARALAALVHEQVRAVDAAAAGALWECLTELGANVQEHADAIGYAAAQTRPSTGEVLFAVVDAGRGLRATLAHRGAATDLQGIELALSGTSRLAEPDRGRGLPSTLRLVRELAGSLYLATGEAATRAGAGASETSVLAEPFPGTMVQGRVRTRARVVARRARGDTGARSTERGG